MCSRVSQSDTTSMIRLADDAQLYNLRGAHTVLDGGTIALSDQAILSNAARDTDLHHGLDDAGERVRRKSVRT